MKGHNRPLGIQGRHTKAILAARKTLRHNRVLAAIRRHRCAAKAASALLTKLQDQSDVGVWLAKEAGKGGSDGSLG